MPIKTTKADEYFTLFIGVFALVIGVLVAVGVLIKPVEGWVLIVGLLYAVSMAFIGLRTIKATLPIKPRTFDTER